MNKKLNSVIYILVATVVNLLLLMTFMALAMGVFALLVHLVPSMGRIWKPVRSCSVDRANSRLMFRNATSG